MRFLLILLTLFVFTGCKDSLDKTVELNPKDICVKSFDINGKVYRCENNEIVCYIYKGYKAGGLQCRFKLK